MTQAAAPKVFHSRKEDPSKYKPWKGICSSRCYVAKTDKKKCKCKCHGQHHGKEHTAKPLDDLLSKFFQADPASLER